MYTQKHSTVQVAWAKLWVLLAFVLVSCKPTVPSDYIQPGEMEDLLYDYHVVMSMAAVKNANVIRLDTTDLINPIQEKDKRTYTLDGTHTNPAGAERVGIYIAKKLKRTIQ